MKTDKSIQKDWRPATRLVRGGLERTPFSETSEALFMTSGYVYDAAEEAEQAFKGEHKRYIYSRYANPTLSMFEERLALIEDAAHCRGTASGMASVFAALLSQLRAGDRVVAARALFGSCHFIVNDLLPRYGIETEFVDGTDLDQWKRALARPAKCVFLETPSNPTLEIIDLPAVGELAHAAGARVVIDNVFATPLLQKPLQQGADVVVYSTTKHIDGQGRSLGGAILANDTAFVDDELTPFLRHTGPGAQPVQCLAPHQGPGNHRPAGRAPSASRHAGSPISLPNNRASKGSSIPAEGIIRNSTSRRGKWPREGTMVAFEVTGGREGAFRFLNALGLIDISNNLGDAKSLITHPATTTHERVGPEERARMGIGDGLLRLSVGLEDPADLCDDLAAGIQASNTP